MNGLYFPINNNSRSEADLIELNKYQSRASKFARQNAKLDYCYHCGNKTTSFCNSHSVPRFCLTRIAVDGHLYQLSDVMDIQYSLNNPGVNKAGTFQLICNKCDAEIFANYENPQIYKQIEISQTALAQIAMKNYLHRISKRKYEIELYNLMLQRAIKNNFFDMQMHFRDELRIKHIDLKEYRDYYKYAKNLISNSCEGYHVILNKHLDYTVPIAFQDCIVLLSDFYSNLLYNSHAIEDASNMKNIHVVVFPLEKGSRIIIFCEKKHSLHYKSFETKLNKLDLDDQLSAINFIMFAYSEEIYLSKKIPQKTINKPALKRIASLAGACTDSNNPLERERTAYSLVNRKKVPNLLSRYFDIDDN